MACLQSLFADDLINSNIALPAETIHTLFRALCHNPQFPPSDEHNNHHHVTDKWGISGPLTVAHLP